ncbi:MAG: nitrate reductase [Bacteroidetes bacterium]|nr:chaperone NapD [Bacteroidales bacterium]RLD52909.1 MAG: nitrate reductase [Bacteroidota bacterium]
MTLSSIVVQTTPENLNKVIERLKKSELCEYHLHDKKGRIIITVEGKTVEEEILKLQQIQKFPKIVSAEMVYSYDEEELDGLRENIGSKVPEWLNDENAKAEDIIYQGDLKKKY